jgi:uncharacterized protein (DUF2141 family)
MPAFAQAPAAQQNVLRVQLDGFRSDKGKAHCSLFNDSDPKAFPSDGSKTFKQGEAPSVKNASAEIDFSGLPAGKYALVCYHDENSSGGILLFQQREAAIFGAQIRPMLVRLQGGRSGDLDYDDQLSAP